MFLFKIFNQSVYEEEKSVAFKHIPEKKVGGVREQTSWGKTQNISYDQ